MLRQFKYATKLEVDEFALMRFNCMHLFFFYDMLSVILIQFHFCLLQGG